MKGMTMSTMTLTSNGHARDLVSFHELPAVEREDFDYVGDEDRFSYRFFEYRGSWYDSSEFEAIGSSHSICDQLKGWHGVQTQSYFDAVVIRYVEDYQRGVVGHAHW